MTLAIAAGRQERDADHDGGRRIQQPAMHNVVRSHPLSATLGAASPLAHGPPQEHPAHASDPQAAEPSVQRKPQPKPADADGDHTHVDPNYPGLRLILDETKTEEYGPEIYRLADPEERVIFDEDGFEYIKFDDGLKTWTSLLKGDLGPDQAQADLKKHFMPQRDTSFHVKSDGQTFHEGQINKIEDFETQEVVPGELVEVSVALLQQASGRTDTVAGELVERKWKNAVVGMRNSAAILPIDIQVIRGRISILNGNHRLYAAVKLNHAYAPCKIVNIN